METAKDYGFNEGYILDKGAISPVDHTKVGAIGENKTLIIPNTILDDEYNLYQSSVGSAKINRDPESFGKTFGAAKAILNSTGLTKQPTSRDTLVGVDFRGDKIYSSPELANSKDVSRGRDLVVTGGVALGAMGAFKDHAETQKFLSMSSFAADPKFHSELDSHKNNGDVKGFISTLGKLGGDRNKSEFTNYKLYENWNNLSPAQKSIGIAGTGMQGYTFDDGQTFETKKITPEIPGIPSMNAAEGLKLASKGVNVAPATKNWKQLTALQETFFFPKNAAEIVNNLNNLGVLGFGTDGRAIPIDEKVMSQYNMNPAPHYGVGAVTIPQGQGVPTGYVKVKDVNSRTVVVPNANKGTAHLNVPDVSSDAAFQIYKTWSGKNKPEKGLAGGSALIGSLDGMTDSNPYSLGAIATHAAYENTGVEKDLGDLSHVGRMSGITLHRLLDGGASKETDRKGLGFHVDGDFSEDSFNQTMKNMRGEYAKKGVSSKEIGYQLSNQAYSEGRLNESQLVAAQKTLNMVFDDNGYTLAQKLMVGKNKGIEITEKRRG